MIFWDYLENSDNSKWNNVKANLLTESQTPV